MNGGNGAGDHEDDRPSMPVPTLLSPDERIDALIDDVRRVDARTQSTLEIAKMNFAHTLNIEASLRGAGIMKARPWRDVALVAGTFAVAFAILHFLEYVVR